MVLRKRNAEGVNHLYLPLRPLLLRQVISSVITSAEDAIFGKD